MTFGSKPQPLTTELFRELEGLFDADIEPDEMCLRRLVRSAEKLPYDEKAESFLVLAGVASLRWELDEVKKFVRSAVSQKRSVAILLNSALTFKGINSPSEAADYALEAAKLAPNDKSAVNDAVEYLMAAGRIREAYSVAASHSKMGLSLEDRIASLLRLISHIEKNQVDEVRLTYELISAHEVLAKNKTRLRVLNWETAIDPDGHEALIFSMFFHGDIAKEMLFEAELAELLVAQEGWNPNKLSVEFSYDKSDALQAA